MQMSTNAVCDDVDSMSHTCWMHTCALFLENQRPLFTDECVKATRKVFLTVVFVSEFLPKAEGYKFTKATCNLI